jgi:hypothetical protein
MMRGILFALCIAVFIASSLLFMAASAGSLTENIITGAVIGNSELASYSLAVMSVSFIAGLVVLVELFRRKK